MSFDELVDQTSELSTVNTGDIYGVIATLIKVIAYELKYGRVIRLGDLGAFYLSIQSEGVDSPEELTSANIHRAVLRFRSGRKIREILRNLRFEKITMKMVSLMMHQKMVMLNLTNRMHESID